MLLQRATNAFMKAKSFATKAQPIVHNINRWGQALSTVAENVPLPGSNAVRLAAKGINLLDKGVTKFANL